MYLFFGMNLQLGLLRRLSYSACVEKSFMENSLSQD
jgi:hypothetical protein